MKFATAFLSTMSISLLSLIQSTAALWIGANIGQCDDPAGVQFSLIKQVNVCMKTPASVSFFRSYKIPSCSITNSMLTASITGYSGSDCTGISVTHALDPIPSTCTNGTTLICEENPIALSENWPAIGLYIEDTTCSLPTAVIAGKSGCNSFEYESYTYSSNLICENNLLSLNVYNTSLTCDGNTQVSETLVAGSCTEFTDFLNQLPDNLPPQLDQLSEYIDITSASYYTACAGTASLPGIAEDVNDDEGGGDDATNDPDENGSTNGSSDNEIKKFGGLGAVGLSFLLIGIVIAGVVGAFVIKRMATVKRTEDTQNILLSVK